MRRANGLSKNGNRGPAPAARPAWLVQMKRERDAALLADLAAGLTFQQAGEKYRLSPEWTKQIIRKEIARRLGFKDHFPPFLSELFSPKPKANASRVRSARGEARHG